MTEECDVRTHCTDSVCSVCTTCTACTVYCIYAFPHSSALLSHTSHWYCTHIHCVLCNQSMNLYTYIYIRRFVWVDKNYKGVYACIEILNIAI